MVQRVLPEDWCDCAMAYYGYVRNAHDKMADGKTAYGNIFLVKCDGPSIPFRTTTPWTNMFLEMFMGYVSGLSGDMLNAGCEDLEKPFNLRIYYVKKFELQDVSQ